MVGRYLTPETIRLGLLGAIAGSVAGVAWRLVGRRWGALPFIIAFVVGTGVAGRFSWPQSDVMAAIGGFVTIMACVGSGTLLADSRIRWEWVAAGALTSTAGVWAGVPETGPPVLAAACFAGLAAQAAVSRSYLSPAAGAGMAVVVGSAAFIGASGRPWAMIGGALCTGIAPWFSLRRLLPESPLSWPPGPWLLCAHAGLTALAARWISVDPQPGWGRVAAVAFAGLAVVLITRRESA